MKQALVIPLYQPNEKVLPFLEEFKREDFARFVIVDDGSGVSYQATFDAIKARGLFEVLSYPKNGGKGHALKTAYAYLKEQCPDIEAIVTADGDGQHAYSDILKVRDALKANPTSLVMGVRDFSAKDVPHHNKVGNRLSALYFRLATGVKLSDTQTGLRGIPSNLFALALESRGERYEYEMNFLMEAVKEAPLVQIPIQTIYDGNKSSHFHPVRDSLRIYKTPLLYILVALLSEGIDLGFFSLFTAIGPSDTLYKILVATVGSRLLSGSFNYTMGYFLVFENNGGFAKKLGRYALVFFLNMGLSFGLTYAFNYLPANLTFIKFVVDLVLFTANYFVARGWIFARKLAHKKDDKHKAEKASGALK
jgi:glycosyltransferase involved in cell wall biosynthesis